jgi:hypothetical protein
VGRLITDEGEICLGRRTTAIVEELHARQEAIEGPRKGRVEITIDFANGSLTVAVREVGESRRIE